MTRYGIHTPLPYILVLLTALGCKTKKDEASQAATKQTAAQPTAQSSDHAVSSGHPGADSKEMQYYSGAHILVAYKGAMRAKPEVKRTKDEAKKLAAKLQKELTQNPDEFDALAKKYSDGPSGPYGGSLGTWPKGRMVPAFQTAIESIKIGEVSDPVETDFGFHVIKRLPVPPDEDLSATQLLVSYQGAQRAKPAIKRTREAAMALATKLAKQAKGNPDGFDALVKKHSDGPAAASGGSLRPWNARTSHMPPIFSTTVMKLKVGQVSDPVETPHGFHIFKRMPPPPEYAGSHILVAYKGAMRAGPKVKRSKAEAKALATKLAKEAQNEPAHFVELAKKYSDGPSGPRGGSLGKWRKGAMVPAFDEAVSKVKIGNVTGPVETPFGFHVIKREALPK